MARITVEDCLDHVENRFKLVILASKRARQLARGGMAMVEVENDKPTVLALREIAEGHVNFPDHRSEEYTETEHDDEIVQSSTHQE